MGGLLHLGPNIITFRTLLHLGQLLHLGLQHRYLWEFLGNSRNKRGFENMSRQIRKRHINRSKKFFEKK